ncbi:MAG: squalene--hopene cyclase [Gammaproteobacteria bacterium]|nr:squalene--hopene cyclase [Gammaproteobacteria bacterium]
MSDKAPLSESVSSPAELLTAVLPEQQPFHSPMPQTDKLSEAISLAATELLQRQDETGWWRFDLEADATIPSEYMLLQHFLGTVDTERESRMVDYLHSRQMKDGSWPLYHAGPGNISATVKAYFALKVAGVDPTSNAMIKARQWVLTHGGAENANVFTRFTLAMFGQAPWRIVPCMPIEIIFLPQWFIFSLNKVSYWSRCVIIPLLILYAKRPVFELKPEQNIRELFIAPPESLKNLDHFVPGKPLKNAFIVIDWVLKKVEPLSPEWLRQKAIDKAEAWTREHMSGEGGIGGIYPAMANAVTALTLLGHDSNDADMARGLKAIDDLVIDEDETYVQPCVSPVWDTCLSISALSEAELKIDHRSFRSAVDWLFDKQVFVRGDWKSKAGDLDCGGWAFQFENDFYPDVDDTCSVVMAMLRIGVHNNPAKLRRIAQAVNWVIGMQNSDGGWGAFDIDNHYEYLNNIPFADHGALVDPSTADLTGRCIEMLAMLGYDRSFTPIARGLQFLQKDQHESGAWFGRWGVNFIYGSWSVLIGLGILGEDSSQPYIKKAINWLCSVQNSDGGWGEDCNSYDDPELKGRGASTASQTAWALLGLMAVGEVNSESVQRGIHYLMRNQESEGAWQESLYSGTGFPRVFYLRYHGYSHYFPLWALSVYRNVKQGLPTKQELVRDSGPIDLGPLPVLQQ